jgi:DHA2 family multidrug resistance protein
MIAYVDDFWLMMILTLAVIPLLVLVRPPKKAPPASPAAKADAEAETLHAALE